MDWILVDPLITKLRPTAVSLFSFQRATKNLFKTNGSNLECQDYVGISSEQTRNLTPWFPSVKKKCSGFQYFFSTANRQELLDFLNDQFKLFSLELGVDGKSQRGRGRIHGFREVL